ncbi:hypothetical protein ACFC4G_06580 [Streptomyces sp. NPDC056002]
MLFPPPELPVLLLIEALVPRDRFGFKRNAVLCIFTGGLLV